MNGKGLIGSITEWFSHPYKAEGNVVNWVLFIGLLTIIAWFWQYVLLSITTD